MDQETLQRYITGNATSQEKEAVACWLDEDKNNMKEFLALRKLYDISIWQQDKNHIAESTSLPRKKQRTLRSLSLEWIKIAAIFAIAFLTTYTFKFIPALNSTVSSVQTIHVPAGQRAEVTLSDGSKVWLNAKTTFTFPNNFTAESREVTLDGEGYFSVSKNKNKPFIVKAGVYDIKVLGTEFNVRAYSGSKTFETALLTGAVEISTSGSIINLEPNTRTYLEEGILKKGPIEYTNYFRWKEGLICFNDETVEDMVNKLQLYFDVKIEVKNKSLLNHRYSGKFRTKDGVEHVLRVLQLSNKFTYEKDDNLNLITIR